MNSRIRRHLDSIFRGSEDTQRLRDFKEELAANLAEKIADLQASGLDEDTAFREAVATLGDVRAVYAHGEEQPRPVSVSKVSRGQIVFFNPLMRRSFSTPPRQHREIASHRSCHTWDRYGCHESCQESEGDLVWLRRHLLSSGCSGESRSF